MYKVNSVKSKHGFFDVEEKHDEQFNYWLLIWKKDKVVGIIKDTTLSEFENKRHDGFLLGKLGKAIDKAFKENSMETATMMWRYDELDFELCIRDILDCSHDGICDNDCQRVVDKEYVQDQLRDVSADKLIGILDAAGIGCDESDRHDIEECIVWDAACNLRSDLLGSLHSKG